MGFSQIRLASPLQFDSIVDGPGIRIVVWCQGCRHKCIACHNPQTHDINLGTLYNIDDLKTQIENSNLQSGITLSGGEPFLQSSALLDIVATAKIKGLNIWAYTGFTYEYLLGNPQMYELLKEVDILVDGKYEEALSDYQLRYKGSSNQRIIDVQASILANHIVLSSYDDQNTKNKVTS